MDWRPIQIMEITWYLSKAHNCKSPGNDQIQNYWLKAFPATHRHIAKNFNAIIEEPEKAPDRLTTGKLIWYQNQETARKPETTGPLHA